MIRILVVAPGLTSGIASVFCNYLNYMGDEFHFDFVSYSKGGAREPELEARGCKVYHLESVSKGIRRHNKTLQEIMRGYDVVHVNNAYRSLPAVYNAKRAGVPVRIAHSHGAHILDTPSGTLLRGLYTRLTKHYATDLAACGQYAGSWCWGKSEFFVVTNGIECEKYAFSEKKRADTRRGLGLGGETFAVGALARLSEEKNLGYALRAFKKLLALRPDSVLLLAGEGPEEAKLRALSEELGITSSARFLGFRLDAPELMCALDAIVAPSFAEGLLMVGVEAQACGLPVFISDTVSDEVGICELARFLPIDGDPEVWARALAEVKPVADRERFAQVVAHGGYDIRENALCLAERYRELYKRAKK